MAKSDYSKDLFKQVQELMLKCDDLSHEVKTIEKRTEKKFKKKNKRAESRIWRKNRKFRKQSYRIRRWKWKIKKW